jgi:hypothetical protein
MPLFDSKRVRAFRDACPDALLVALGSAIRRSYVINAAEALAHCPEIQQYHAAQSLRARSETEFVAVTRTLTPAVTGSWEANRTKNYSFFRISLRGGVALTQHRVDDFRALPRSSEWRSEQAEAQYVLGLDGDRQIPKATCGIYALMTHGSAQATAAAPDFIRIRFLLAGGDALEDSVDVLDILNRQKTEQAERSRVERVARPILTPKARPGKAS